MKKISVLIFLVLLVVGCTQGVELDSKALQQDVVIGKTTKEDIVRMCGEPLGKRFSPDNKTEIWHYAYVKKGVTGPGVLGHIVGVGVETKSEKVVFQPEFQENVLVDFKLEEGNTKHFSYQ